MHPPPPHAPRKEFKIIKNDHQNVIKQIEFSLIDHIDMYIYGFYVIWGREIRFLGF